MFSTEAAMFRAGIVALLLAIGSGCASQAQTVGAAGGAAIGAAVGGGSALSTIGGAMVGYGAGRAYDQRQNR
jgi:hypothetical protein